MLCQFLILPFVGFASSRIFGVEGVDGIMLLVVVSSPGGAYSNLWSSLGNADLALSVTATALSTILAAALLPLNLLLYLTATYGSSVLDSLRWDMLLLTIGVVTAAVATGLGVSWQLQRDSERGRRLPRRVEALRWRCNALGNAAGLALIAFSLVFVYGAELFPTSVRNLAIGLSSTSGRVGSVLAPLVVLLGSQGDERLPMLLFAAMTLAAGAYAATLPETRGKPSPETIDDVTRLS